MKIMLSLANDEPKDFKDIFRGATQELQAIAQRREARERVSPFPPFDLPEPDFSAAELVQPEKPIKGIAVDVFSKYRDPKYGFFGESFARMLDAERTRGKPNAG